MEVFFGLNEHHTLNMAAGVVIFFLCFDVNYEIFVSGAGVSHIINVKKAAVQMWNNQLFLCIKGKI